MTNRWSSWAARGRPEVLLAALMAACGGGGAGAEDASGAPQLDKRDTAVAHEPCDLESDGAERTDVNGDGATDVTVVKVSGVESCRALDLNFDGVIDAWVYRDTSGEVRRRENDYDRDGRVDEIAVFRGGMLVEKQRATTLGGRLDTWQYYQAGRIARTERDSNGDAVVDQWWEYPHLDRPECPLIHSDVNGDGRPDPGVSVDVCAEQGRYVAPIDTGERKPFDFEGPAGALPTEVEERDAPGEGTSTEHPPAEAPGGAGGLK